MSPGLAHFFHPQPFWDTPAHIPFHWQSTPPRSENTPDVLILVLAAVALFCGTFWAVQSFMSRDEVVVPDLRDKTLLEAEQLLSDNSLKIVVEDEVFDGEIKTKISTCLLFTLRDGSS
mgnify:CR=1 FL=1